MSPEKNRKSDTTAVLLVSCQDRPGLVAALAQLLYGHGANILDADVFLGKLTPRCIPALLDEGASALTHQARAREL